MSDWEAGNLLYLVLLLAAVMSGGALWRAGWSANLRNAGGWLAIIALLAIGYAYRGEFQSVFGRVMSELSPSRGSVSAQGMRYVMDDDGHFRVRTLVNGQPIVMLVDTGATSVALSPADARRLGADPESLDYGMTVTTANGEAKAAPLLIEDFRIGDTIQLRNVRALVTQAELDQSLLGMSVLSRLGGYRVEDGVLILQPPR